MSALILFIPTFNKIYAIDITARAAEQAVKAAEQTLKAAGQTTFPARKYAFTQDELRRIASMCYMENGTSENGMRAEASIMANLYERDGDGRGTTSGFIKYITTGGWFAAASVNYYRNPINVSSSYLAAVKDVLVDGNRYFPVYVDEHDCMSDISYVSNNGVTFDKYSRSSYKKDVTVIKRARKEEELDAETAKDLNFTFILSFNVSTPQTSPFPSSVSTIEPIPGSFFSLSS